MNWSWGSRLITGRIHVRWRAEAVPWWTESPPSTAPKATRFQMQFRLKRAFVGSSGVGGGTQMCLTAEVWPRFKWVVPPEAGPEGPSLEPGEWDRGDAEGAALSPASEPRDDVRGGAAGEASAHSLWLYALGLYRAVLLPKSGTNDTSTSVSVIPGYGGGTAETTGPAPGSSSSGSGRPAPSAPSAPAQGAARRPRPSPPQRLTHPRQRRAGPNHGACRRRGFWPRGMGGACVGVLPSREPSLGRRGRPRKPVGFASVQFQSFLAKNLAILGN